MPQRLQPPTPLPACYPSPWLQTDREVQLRSGAVVPKGTVLWMSVVSLHTSQNNFEQPLRFWPERWEQLRQQAQQQEAAGLVADTAAVHSGGNSSSSGSSDRSTGGGCPFAGLGRPTPAGNSAALQRSFMAFSYGPRDCLGQVRVACHHLGLKISEALLTRGSRMHCVCLRCPMPDVWHECCVF